MQTTNRPRVNLTVSADRAYAFMLLSRFSKKE